MVTGGGFISEDQADSNDKSLNLDNLKATHEEVDTRMILHMLHFENVSNCRTIAVSATDIDVFLFTASCLRNGYQAMDDDRNV